MFSKLPQPIPPVLVIRILVALIILLAFLAAYYQSALQVERQKNEQLSMSLKVTQ